MKHLLLIAGCITCMLSSGYAQNYNPLHIPDTLVGPTFELHMIDTFKQFFPGQQTITSGFNGDWWGPTLIMNKGENVQMYVHNHLNDSSTVHWHGMHLPAVMDGGPHQIIPPGTIWSPYWKVDNFAATYFYHPHLHEMTEKQLAAGLGGFLIIRDSAEAALKLPRTYGVDDIPLAITDRKFTSDNQIRYKDAHYGDTVIVNGVMNATVTLPAQIVRLRLLDLAQERAYLLGFSDNRNFWVIAGDGGLLDTPVVMNRLLMGVAERYEILVDLNGMEGKELKLMAYNASLATDVNGSEPANTPVPFGNKLGRKNFMILHMKVDPKTANPITNIPKQLVKNTYFDAATAVKERKVVLGDEPNSNIFATRSWLDGRFFVFDRIDHYVPLDNTEIWAIKDESLGSHAFHIHDIEFKILDINGAPPPAHEAGWKDVVYVRRNTTVRFITKFTDFADTIKPFMYHCHILFHEDEGMMGQFLVVPPGFQIPPDSTTSVLSPIQKTNYAIEVFPNPASSVLYFKDPKDAGMYYADVFNQAGYNVLRVPGPDAQLGINISFLPQGTYFIRFTDQRKRTYVAQFVKIVRE